MSVQVKSEKPTPFMGGSMSVQAIRGESDGIILSM